MSFFIVSSSFRMFAIFSAFTCRLIVFFTVSHVLKDPIDDGDTSSPVKTSSSSCARSSQALAKL